MPPPAPWTIDAYQTEKGGKPIWSFIGSLAGRNKAEAMALVKLCGGAG